MKSTLRRTGLLLVASLLWFGTAHASLQLTFTNLTGLDDSEVFIYFDSSFSGTFNNGGNSFEPLKSYSLATIGTGSGANSGVTLSGAGGRIYSVLESPFPATTNPPQFVNPPTPADNNSFNNRHQLLGEITTGAVGNLSNIDWVTQPAAMRTFDSSGNQLERIGYSDNYNGATLRTKLNTLTGGDAEIFSVSNLAGNDPTEYDRDGMPTVRSQNPAAGSPVRIVGGSQTGYLVDNNLNSYPTFRPYIESIAANNPEPSAAAPVAKLEGQFFAVEAPDGKYYQASVTGFTATEAGSNLGTVTIEGTTYTSYDEGTGTFSGKVNDFEIVIPKESLNDITIYGGTTGTPGGGGGGEGYNLSVEGGPSTPTDGGSNSIYTLAVRDFIAGLNYGFIDSITVNPNDPGSGTLYKDSASAYWGTTNLLTGGIFDESPKYFGELQESDFYNVWASVISEESNNSVYGFSYDDTFNKVQIDLGSGVDRLDIILLADIYTVIPEPQTYALLIGFCALGFARLRKRKPT